MSTPAEGTPSAQPVIVGIDGSPSSKAALRWAVFMAQTLHSSVHAVTAWQISAGWASATWAGADIEWNPAEDAAKVLADTVREVLGDQPSSGLTTRVDQGGAAEVLLDASQNSPMLVLGNRGRGGFAGLLLGSVSAACVAHAQCPVLVVHSTTSPPPAAP